MAGERKIVDAYVQISARGVEGVDRALNSVETSAARAYRGLASIGQIAIGNVAANAFTALAAAVSQVPAAMISANAEFEKSSVMLEVLLGSADAAKKRIEELNKFAAETPFELPGILQTSKQLELANIPAQEHQKVLKMTGDMAAAAGVDISELGMWVSRSYAAIQAGQPWGEAAMRLQELGVLSVDARQKLEGLTESGASGKEVWAAFQQEMGRFDGMMQKQSQTWLGLTSTFSDGITQMMRVMGEPLFNAAKEGLGSVVDLLASTEVTAAAQSMGESIAAGFASLMDTAQQLGGIILEIAGGGDVVSASLMGLGEIAAAVLTAAIDTAAAFADALELLLSPLFAIRDVIGTAILESLRIFGVEAESRASVVSSAFGGVAEVISMIGVGLQTIVTVVRTVAATVVQVLTNLGTNIKAIWEKAWAAVFGGDVQTQMVDLMDGVTEIVAGMDLPDVGVVVSPELDRAKLSEIEAKLKSLKGGEGSKEEGPEERPQKENVWGEATRDPLGGKQDVWEGRGEDKTPWPERKRENIWGEAVPAMSDEDVWEKRNQNNKGDTVWERDGEVSTEEFRDQQSGRRRRRMDDSGSIVNSASFLERLQKAAFSQAGGEKTAKEQLDTTKKGNVLLEQIRDRMTPVGGAVLG